jgi:hypothetical protein
LEKNITIQMFGPFFGTYNRTMFQLLLQFLAVICYGPTNGAFMTDDTAFVEQDTTTAEPSYKGRPLKSIKLAMNEDGTINWDGMSERHIDAFIDAIKKDPKGILDNIKEEASQSPDEEPTGIADATVLTCVNLIMVIEAIGMTTLGPRYVPVLRNLHPAVAVKACAVEMDQIKPIMAPAKRIIKRYVPLDYLSQEYQDIFIVGEHIIGMGITKFKDCVALAKEIENQRSTPTQRTNGKVVDAEFVENPIDKEPHE